MQSPFKASGELSHCTIWSLLISNQQRSVVQPHHCSSTTFLNIVTARMFRYAFHTFKVPRFPGSTTHDVWRARYITPLFLCDRTKLYVTILHGIYYLYSIRSVMHGATSRLQSRVLQMLKDGGMYQSEWGCDSARENGFPGLAVALDEGLSGVRVI